MKVILAGIFAVSFLASAASAHTLPLPLLCKNIIPTQKQEILISKVGSSFKSQLFDAGKEMRPNRTERNLTVSRNTVSRLSASIPGRPGVTTTTETFRGTAYLLVIKTTDGANYKGRFDGKAPHLSHFDGNTRLKNDQPWNFEVACKKQ